MSFKTELLTEAIIHRGYRESLPELLPKIPKFRNRMIIDNDIYIDLTETSKIQEYFSSKTIKNVAKFIKLSSNNQRISSEYQKSVSKIQKVFRIKNYPHGCRNSSKHMKNYRRDRCADDNRFDY